MKLVESVMNLLGWLFAIAVIVIFISLIQQLGGTNELNSAIQSLISWITSIVS